MSIRIEVIHKRFSDYSCHHEVYVNGELSDDAVEFYNLDAGAGCTFSDWAADAAAMKAVASPAVWTSLEEYFASPGGDGVEGLPDEGDWLDRLDDNPENRAWWAEALPGAVIFE